MKSHHETESLIIVARFPFEAEAAPVVEALKSAGIAVTMTGGFTAGFIAEAPGDIQIKVLENDVERAREVLANFAEENDHIDWDKVDVGVPEDE